jgi:hypothetical protein
VFDAAGGGQMLESVVVDVADFLIALTVSSQSWRHQSNDHQHQGK